MKDAECVAFLHWCLPKLGYRWAGFRKVRRQVCRRIRTRYEALGISDLSGYRSYLTMHDEEWAELDPLCRVTISRFYRDRGTFDMLAEHVLPTLLQRAVLAGRSSVEAWSAGCASGEEPYSLQITWQRVVQPAAGHGPPLRIVATDIDSRLLDRARYALYPAGSLKDLPDDLEAVAFERDGEDRILRPAFRQSIEWRAEDIRNQAPEGGPFDLVLCRNLAFTYFDDSVQERALERICAVMRPHGFLVIGTHEVLPPHSRSVFSHLGQAVFELTT